MFSGVILETPALLSFGATLAPIVSPWSPAGAMIGADDVTAMIGPGDSRAVRRAVHADDHADHGNRTAKGRPGGAASRSKAALPLFAFYPTH